MKLFPKYSITLRLTLLTGALIFCTSLGVTLISQKNANDRIVQPLYKTIYQSSVDLDQESFDIEVLPIYPSDEATLPPQVLDVRTEAIASTLVTAKKEFNLSSYYYLILISVIGMILAYCICKRALEPLISLNECVSKTDEHNLQARIPTTKRLDEVASLSHSFNAMLERLEQSFLRQKRFSANVAHELKTPLATMQATLQVLELDEKPVLEDYQETNQIIKKQLERLNVVVDQLFNLSLDNFVNEAKSVDCTFMFQHILDELKETTLPNKLTINLHSNHEIMMANPIMIERAFFNIVENAIKYNRLHGSIDIYVETEGQLPRFTIVDTGIGMEESELTKILEPFYRVDASRCRKIAGAGLGLSIVSLIFEKHDYHLTIESELNKGTTIHVFPKIQN